MWSLIPQKLIPPTQTVRYCCSILKENGGTGRFITTGIRRAESGKRMGRGIYETLRSDKKKKIILNNDNDDRRRLFENCALNAKRVCNPIIDWTDRDIWGYIEAEKLPVNPLYQCGFYRVGCVGCPMAGKVGRRGDFARYPKYRAAYIAAFERMLEERRRCGKTDGSWRSGTTGLDVFHWWMKDGVLPGQLNFDDIAGFMEDDGEGMEPDTRRGVTLAAVLSLLQPHENVFILHRISPHELEAIDGGTVEELRAIRFVEMCGGYEVERLELTVNDITEGWTKLDKPALAITIRERED